MLPYKNIICEIKNHIALITINHPPANTWNLVTMEEFEHAVGEVASDNNVRVVMITGSGEKCFSAGFDVSDAANASITSPKGREVWRTLDRLSKPTVAVINGHALGGGLELAISCHFRIMVDRPDAMLGLTELNLGIIPGWGGTQRLSRLVGRAKALDMILFSKRINAREALDIGLVDLVADKDSLVKNAFEFAEKLALRPPVAVRCVLDAFSAGIYEGVDRGLEVEALGSATVRDSEDKNEGFKAFLEKRQPCFQGK
ncbi:MAG: enoyl-CoA hydratase/isomerase family protein [Desulfamplus sp.]|nr:enoyl-CoA hydratase/isomerase family protein [Desulfamplus sp.]